LDYRNEFLWTNEERLKIFQIEHNWSITFLGVELDTIKMEMRLPQDKIIELTNRLKTCFDAKKYPFVERKIFK
jgi:hypothetical protein